MKKNLNLEQLRKDGFVQLKSKRQLLKQGIITKDCSDFDKVQYNPYLCDYMLNSFGKIVPFNQFLILEEYIDVLFRSTNDYVWPIECIKC